MSRPDPDGFRLIDTFDAVDVGQGYSLSHLVDVDGTRWPLLYDTRQRAPQFFPHLDEDWRRLAPHEMNGSLPREFAQFWCGAPARTGKPCRTRVAAPGVRCRHHQEPPAVAPATHPPLSDPVLFDLEPPSETP